jgi:hypothetical protein
MLIIWKLGFWISLLFTCRASDSEISDKIIDSVEFQESRGVYSVRSNGSCTGLMQVNYHYAPFSQSLLKVPVINRTVGTRMLRHWKKRSRNNIKYALAAYNCGNKGLDGRCGIGYASSVLSRNLHYRRYNIPACSLIGRSINFYIDNEKNIKKGLTRLKTSFIIESNSKKHKWR